MALMKTLTWREVIGLAFTLNRHRDTVERWKYGRQTPNAWMMLEAIDWVRRGKPSLTTSPRNTRQLML